MAGLKLNLAEFKKIFESLSKGTQQKSKRKRETISPYLKKCKYCKYLELMYCKYHTVTIHPESRACPAFVLKEEFASSSETSREQTF